MPIIKGPSSGSADAPQQHSQPSRKGKKAWRKNVDVTEVQKGLEDLNEEIIRGGVIKEKPSSELFTIDVARATKENNKPKHGKKLLKADEIIARRSAVPAVPMRKRAGDKTTDGLLPAKRQRTDWVPHKELARLRKVADGQHETTVVAKDATYDIWDAPSEPVTETVLDFLPEKQKAKPQNYENRLAEESAKALEAEKKRLEAEEAERLRQEAAARSAAEAEAAEERANMSEWEEDSEWEGFQSGVDDDKPAQKQPKRKTQAQRNRIKRRKEEERLAKHKAAMKERRVQEQRIKAIAEEVAEREQQRALALAEDSDSASEVTDDKLRRRQLGKFKLPEKDLELVLPDELQESLRLLKPEGNLLKDRYRSMLVRGKVESRRHIPFKKQARKKLTEKWTHKDFVL
ncbi:hypothetical protein ACCO45_005654 [Purpureocillium lilacinum]|uniref:Uncharacterized protein n=1 Tax=Purpureocillium lilacinum TaxID=33203 RepID=A0ACC4DWS8_PURLI